MSQLAFLTERSWVDEDGYHIWIEHDCTDGREATMLPWPTWQAGADGRVLPSIDCRACGAHYFTTVLTPRPGWREALPDETPGELTPEAIHGVTEGVEDVQ